jgi:hypothetical protein
MDKPLGTFVEEIEEMRLRIETICQDFSEDGFRSRQSNGPTTQKSLFQDSRNRRLRKTLVGTSDEGRLPDERKESGMKEMYWKG